MLCMGVSARLRMRRAARRPRASMPWLVAVLAVASPAMQAACGLIPGTYPLFAGDELEIKDGVTISGNAISSGIACIEDPVVIEKILPTSTAKPLAAPLGDYPRVGRHPRAACSANKHQPRQHVLRHRRRGTVDVVSSVESVEKVALKYRISTRSRASFGPTLRRRIRPRVFSELTILDGIAEKGANSVYTS